MKNGMYMARKRTKYTPKTYRSRFGSYSAPSPELKFLDNTWDSDPVPSAGVIALNTVNNVAAGTGESQRVGRKITIKSIHLRWVNVIKASASNADTDDGLRLILYLDKQANGAAATVTDILETADYLSFNNLSNRNRFRVLMDRVVDVSSMSGGSSTAFGAAAKTKQAHLRCDIPIEFSSTTGAITEMRSNNVGVLIISDNQEAECVGNVRIRYTDS